MAELHVLSFDDEEDEEEHACARHTIARSVARASAAAFAGNDRAEAMTR
jgi:hypothetical protein